MSKSLPNMIVDNMIAARLESHPGEVWSRDVSLAEQAALFPGASGIAAESDAGRGAIAVDLKGIVPVAGGAILDTIFVSVKSTHGAGRRHGRTAIFTTGTLDHVVNVMRALLDPSKSFPVVFAHQNDDDAQWVQCFFDAGEVTREVLAKHGQGDTGIGPLVWATGERGIPMTLRETKRKGTDNSYYQLNFNMGVLVTPAGEPVPRAPGVLGLGLAEPWREVDYPEIQWERA